MNVNKVQAKTIFYKALADYMGLVACKHSIDALIKEYDFINQQGLIEGIAIRWSDTDSRFSIALFNLLIVECAKPKQNFIISTHLRAIHCM